MRIPDDIKKEILDRAGQNIVQLIGEVIPLTKAGTTYKACCPFHNEKTPSFTVNPSRGTWHCFGQCNDGGDVAKFFMLRDGIKFPDALALLARRVGITIPQGETKEEKERKAMLHALAKAQYFFQQGLSENRNGGRAYADSRLTPYEVERHGIGYAPKGGRALVDYLDKSGVPFWAAEKAGLIRREENGPYKDCFWGRVMFPIRDDRGRVIAFAGRRTDKIKTLKYVNSPESPLYKKEATLYGIDTAIQAIQETGEVYVVEGYFDAIAMISAGILNTVATCGTAFTKEHAAVLRRYCTRVNFMFDGDAAGKKALQKATLLALKEEFTVTAYLLTEDQDPDSFFKSGESFNEIRSMTGLDYLKESGAEMSPIHKKLHRLERLERGLFYMAEKIPEVRGMIAKSGNLEELFSPDLLPAIHDVINTPPPPFSPRVQRMIETLVRVKASLELGNTAEPTVRSAMLLDVGEALSLIG
ncbi:DNA primase [Pelobacter propionicus]|uniref:DNA primase n=1 Tax=Pelobacter propionicus (strain DSM 2379 / NBRC 103807 / OttBd1) TaxID=338966 RepID=A0R7W2_PELPD|nr:DNA primase [Pelobacter propionicus]ABL01319.1 DNA primase [Pelobacter propionicus DSM 2379]